MILGMERSLVVDMDMPNLDIDICHPRDLKYDLLMLQPKLIKQG